MLRPTIYGRAVRLAVFLAPAIGAVTFLSCQSSIDRARQELDPVYRSSKLLREQLKAGVSQNEFNRLRANFATELGVIKDRMQAKPGTAELLQPYFSAYASALDAYSLVSNVLEYRSAMDACTGPKPEFSREGSSGAPLSERARRLQTEVEWMERSLGCVDRAQKARQAINERSEQLNTNCGTDVEWHLDCVVKFADGKLSAAEKLLISR